jgi:8-oxo-dGTP diphosphatase
MNTPRQYVIGFLFDDKGWHVSLILKARPAWQAGYLNGIGGKIEPTDASPRAAMRREFHEEAGVMVPLERWDYFASMGNRFWRCEVFKAFSTASIYAMLSATDETVMIADTRKLHQYKTISSVPWLVALALDRGMDLDGPPRLASISYCASDKAQAYHSGT